MVDLEVEEGKVARRVAAAAATLLGVRKGQSSRFKVSNDSFCCRKSIRGDFDILFGNHFRDQPPRARYHSILFIFFLLRKVVMEIVINVFE